MTSQVDVQTNRARREWSRQTQIARVLWGLCQPLFRLSPRPFWRWRVWLLRCFGAQIAKGVHIHPSARIGMPWHLRIDADAALGDGVIVYALGNIHIGARATVSQYAHLCAGTHDHRDPTRPLVRLPIHIGADAWVCADAFVGPGVRIGAAAILAARAVAMRNVPAGQMGVGNPMQLRAKT